MTALNARDSFCDFDRSKLLKLSDFYPDDFSSAERMSFDHELGLYISSISDLARVMVETMKHATFPLVYRLLKLALGLPVATASVERCFSAMKLVKSDLRNRIADDFFEWLCNLCNRNRSTCASYK
ncbi:hypothetical protein OSB04_012755 [Centaurea solstitialis]|uniref:HAT C-terminal dimerisation domain-containing protein n=1 Tax=Centaurea solstitialis TaxID=347529 RepID=A0AA38WQV0_9ASTR|nr:hypothetical protein OSB04_012755 [Centaurea solstitialis]